MNAQNDPWDLVSRALFLHAPGGARAANNITILSR